MKEKYKKIILLLAIILLSCTMLTSINAAVTQNNGTVGLSQGTLQDVGNAISEVVNVVGEAAMSGVFATITTTINLLTLALTLLMWVFLGSATTNLHLPFPDVLVFNRNAFFDANFINPANNSLLKSFGSIPKNMFTSFQTIAISLFVIAAMVTGIKMALSTVAAKKAQYKESALKWLTGFIILICLKWIIAGLFYINENIVALLYKASTGSSISMELYFSDAVPIYGKLITEIVKAVESTEGDLGISAQGYTGIFLYNLLQAFGGNIVSSLVGFVLIGQTLTIAISYLKRVFMALLFGIISPLVVAIDSIMSAFGRQSTIFSSWLKNFATTVFLQSIHSAYMLVALSIMSGIYKNGAYTGGLNGTQTAIVTIFLTTGLVKLEKMFKSVFGLGDGFGGDLKAGAKGMMQAMGAVRGIATGLDAVRDNKGKMDSANKKKDAYMNQLNREKAARASERQKELYNKAIEAKKSGNMDDYHKYMKEAAEQRRLAKEFPEYRNQNIQLNNNQSNNAPADNKNSGDYLEQVIKNNSTGLTQEDRIKKLEEGIAQETANAKAGLFASVMAPANLAAGIGLGLGIDDEIGESLFKGGYITKGLDAASEKIGSRAADRDRKTFARMERDDGEKYSYTPSEKIIREKTVVEQRMTNGQLYINPAAIGKEISKQFKQGADVFTDQFKRNMREIDRDIDNN